jgi:hypothetical protein
MVEIKPGYRSLSGREAIFEFDLSALKGGRQASENYELIADSILQSCGTWESRLQEAQYPGIRLDLGSRGQANLLRGHRLDCYAAAFADQVKELTGRQLSSMELTKTANPISALTVGETTPDAAFPGRSAVTITTRRSYATPAFADEIGSATARLRNSLRMDVPLRLDLSFVTGLPRTWSRLWRPTVDAIFGSLQERNAAVADQVTVLKLDHYSVGDELEHKVQISVRASEIK